MIQSFKGIEPKIDDSCYIAENSSVIGQVVLGKNTSIWPSAVLRGDIDKIIIGENSNVQDCSALHCILGVPVIVGDNVTIGHGAILHSCKIGNNSLIGMGAIVLDNAIVGNNCLIGAGAVVTPNTVIPDGSMVLGSPAKVKRELSKDEIDNITKNALSYVKLLNEYK